MWLFVLLVGCESEPQSWVAHGETASVGVSADSGRVLAYVCGTDDETRQEWTRWFAGELVGGGFAIERDGWQLRGVPEGRGMGIELDGPGDEASSWSAGFELDGGLYEHIGDCRDGAIAGMGEVVGTWCDPAGTKHQVEPADTLVDFGEQLELLTPQEDPLVFDQALP